MNSLQPNPSNAAAATLVQPDWNSAYGEGQAPGSDDAKNFATLYAAARAGEITRQA